MKLEKMVDELERVEREIDKRADKLVNELKELPAETLYALSERLRKVRQEIEDVSDILDRKFPTIPH